MKIIYNQFVDFLGFLFFYTIKDAYIKQFETSSNSKKSNTVENIIIGLINHMDENLSNYQKNDINLLFKNNINNVYLIKEVIKNTIQTKKSFYDMIDSISSENYVAFIIENLGIQYEKEVTLEDVLNAENLKGVLALEVLDDYDEVVQWLYEYIKYPNQTIDKMAMLLKEVYALFEVYTERKKSSIPKIQHQKKVEVEPFVSNCFGKKIDLKEYSQFYRCYFSRGYNMNDDKNGIIISSFEIDSASKGNRLDKFQYLEIIKTISDEKRIKIIRLLNNKKLCNTDLAELLELTPATISYHLNRLVRNNFLSTEKGSYNKLFYTVNKEVIKDKMNQAYEFLISKEEKND